MKNNFVAIILVFLVFPHFGTSQDSLNSHLRYEVNKIYPSFSIEKEKLNDARTLMDLNDHYKSSWIKEYVSVEIMSSHKGEIRTVMGKSDVLNREQKDNITIADAGTGISVKIQYIPENTLTHNDIKEIHFELMVDPESDAKYPGGQQQMVQFLEENAMDKISGASFQNYDLAAVRFSVDETGQLSDVHLFWSSEDREIDELLVEAICNMPNWMPAEYSNGTRVKQEFVLTVGNHENCAMPLLNIRRD